MVEIEALFERYEWAAEQPEPGIWRATFSTERDEEFDLYVMAGEAALHFAVSPLVTRPDPACEGRVNALLLRLNQQIALVYFGTDDDGDVNLLADLPLGAVGYAGFAAILDALTETTGYIAYELRRLAHDPTYHSPLLPAP